MLDNDIRWTCANAAYDLRQLIQQWSGLSFEDKRSIIEDAIIALDKIPAPDDPEYGN